MDYIVCERNLCTLNGFDKLDKDYLVFTFNANTITIMSTSKKRHDTEAKFYTENRTEIFDEKIIKEMKKRSITFLQFHYTIAYYISDQIVQKKLTEEKYYYLFAKELLAKSINDDSYSDLYSKDYVNFLQINDIYLQKKETVIFSISDKAYVNYIAPIITEYMSSEHIPWTNTYNKSEINGINQLLKNIVPHIRNYNMALYNFYFNIIINFNLFIHNTFASHLIIERSKDFH